MRESPEKYVVCRNRTLMQKTWLADVNLLHVCNQGWPFAVFIRQTGRWSNPFAALSSACTGSAPRQVGTKNTHSSIALIVRAASKITDSPFATTTVAWTLTLDGEDNCPIGNQGVGCPQHKSAIVDYWRARQHPVLTSLQAPLA